MSSVTIQGNLSGTGIFTIASPNSNTSRTLNLPDQSGVFITTDSSGAAVLPRIDSSNEGGQINFNRAVDNVANWSIDSFGNNTTPTLRFIDNGNVRAAIDGSGNLQFNSGYGSVATAFGCRAWVNFNGTGTVSIRASGNVSSITDNGTGNYTVNFTTSMPDGDYSVVGSANFNNTATSISDFAFYETNTTGVRVLSHDSAGATLFDAQEICVSIFR